MKAPEGIIAVIGLGYVGLPLAVEFGKRRPVIGFDTKPERIAELRAVRDHTREVAPEELSAAQHLEVTSNPSALAKASIFIVTVPTPIDAHILVIGRVRERQQLVHPPNGIEPTLQRIHRTERSLLLKKADDRRATRRNGIDAATRTPFREGLEVGLVAADRGGRIGALKPLEVRLPVRHTNIP